MFNIMLNKIICYLSLFLYLLKQNNEAASQPTEAHAVAQLEGSRLNRS